MIKIQGKDCRKIIKEEIEVEYIDFNSTDNENGKLISESVNAYKLKQLSLDNNIEALHFINTTGDKLEFLIEKISTLSVRNSSAYVSIFCPDLYSNSFDKEENILKKINKKNIKISPTLNFFENRKVIVKTQRFLFPRFWTKYMKMIWLQNNNYPTHSKTFTRTSTFYQVIYIKHMVIFKYYIMKRNRHY
ncbi:hypothetical protein [Clostridioides sp. ES-S-0048-02]|uniref:hypothetical protein n=1 Tax=Clostridioides sp. ES-S-0048-02 TaxID=2770777 RepID=UPI001D123499|nr:hypothetical protein [Clostridioides sp. ES-S-0048-02]